MGWIGWIQGPPKPVLPADLSGDRSIEEEADDFLLLDHEGKARELFQPQQPQTLVSRRG